MEISAGIFETGVINEHLAIKNFFQLFTSLNDF